MLNTHNSNHIKLLKRPLVTGLGENSSHGKLVEGCRECSNRIKTNGSLMKKGLPPPEILKFELPEPVSTHPSRSKLKTAEADKLDVKCPPLNMKKVKHEVVKFAMDGFKKQRKMDEMVAMAIRLGAKPPKRDYMNYKALKEKHKLQREEAKREIESMHKERVKMPKRPSSRRPKKDMNKVPGFDSQVGHFTGGVQCLSRRDLMQLRKRK